jgi:hypothetical protein
VTRVAARVFGVPISIVSLVDREEIWFKSHHGIDAEQTDRAPGLCASAILQDAPWVVTDARADARTLSNPLCAELGCAVTPACRCGRRRARTSAP